MITKIKSILRNPVRNVLLRKQHAARLTMGKKKEKPQIIICFDGFSQHGGLVDRMKGVLSYYEVAKALGYDFKIYHTSPYPLTAFLAPNQWNWVATEEDMQWNPTKTKFMYTMLEVNMNPLETIKKSDAETFFVYNNMDYFDKLFPQLSEEERKARWSESFKELFKPSDYLQKAIDDLHLPKNKIAFHTRFTSVLGDFVDTVTQVYSEEKQQKLLQQLKDAISKIAAQYPEKEVFVFSDSIKYLTFIKNHTDFNVLEGEPLHPDNKNDNFDYELHLKTFLDFFAIALCDEIILVRTNYIYNSAYPRYASYLYNKNFRHEIIE